jgi:hypothetical protein
MSCHRKHEYIMNFKSQPPTSSMCFFYKVVLLKVFDLTPFLYFFDVYWNMSTVLTTKYIYL